MGRLRAKKKHRGIKDPYKQMEARFDKIKHKINRRPVNDETQEVPRNLQALIDYQKGKNKKTKEEESKNAKGNKKSKNKKGIGSLIDTASLVSMEKEQYGMNRPLKSIPRFVQYSDETDEQFLRRVGSAAQEMVHECKFEEKFKVEIQRDEAGNIVKMKRQNALEDPLLPAKKRAKLEAKEKIKKEKKKERELKRRQRGRKTKESDDFGKFQDKVLFGEVVYEPPSLDTLKLKKMANSDTKTKSFLFMEKLKESQAGKTPELTMSRKQMLEDERLRAVEAYRELKAAKLNSLNKNFAIL